MKAWPYLALSICLSALGNNPQQENLLIGLSPRLQNALGKRVGLAILAPAVEPKELSKLDEWIMKRRERDGIEAIPYEPLLLGFGILMRIQDSKRVAQYYRRQKELAFGKKYLGDVHDAIGSSNTQLVRSALQGVTVIDLSAFIVHYRKDFQRNIDARRTNVEDRLENRGLYPSEQRELTKKLTALKEIEGLLDSYLEYS